MGKYLDLDEKYQKERFRIWHIIWSKRQSEGQDVQANFFMRMWNHMPRILPQSQPPQPTFTPSSGAAPSSAPSSGAAPKTSIEPTPGTFKPIPSIPIQDVMESGAGASGILDIPSGGAGETINFDSNMDFSGKDIKVSTLNKNQIIKLSKEGEPTLSTYLKTIEYPFPVALKGNSDNISSVQTTCAADSGDQNPVIKVFNVLTDAQNQALNAFKSSCERQSVTENILVNVESVLKITKEGQIEALRNDVEKTGILGKLRGSHNLNHWIYDDNRNSYKQFKRVYVVDDHVKHYNPENVDTLALDCLQEALVTSNTSPDKINEIFTEASTNIWSLDNYEKASPLKKSAIGCIFPFKLGLDRALPHDPEAIELMLNWISEVFFKTSDECKLNVSENNLCREKLAKYIVNTGFLKDQSYSPATMYYITYFVTYFDGYTEGQKIIQIFKADDGHVYPAVPYDVAKKERVKLEELNIFTTSVAGGDTKYSIQKGEKHISKVLDECDFKMYFLEEKTFKTFTQEQQKYLYDKSTDKLVKGECDFLKRRSLFSAFKGIFGYDRKYEYYMYAGGKWHGITVKNFDKSNVNSSIDYNKLIEYISG